MKKRLIIVISIITLFIILAVIGAKNYSSKVKQSQTQTVDVYFLNQADKSLEPEKRNLTTSTTLENVRETLNILFESGPLSQNLKIPTNEKVAVTKIYVSGTDAIVHFSKGYNDLSDVDKIYVKASTTWSLTSIPNIDGVILYVGNEIIPIANDYSLYTDGVEKDEKIDVYDRGYVFLNPTIDPLNSIVITLNLFFVDDKEYTLNEEIRGNIYSNPNVTKEYYVVDELIKGTEVEGLVSVIPKSTKIINIETDNRICYVNLSSDFITKQSENLKVRQLAVYQIVNSLTILDHVDAVQIFIDSKKIDGFGSELDISEVLVMDESLVGKRSATEEKTITEEENIIKEKNVTEE